MINNLILLLVNVTMSGASILYLPLYLVHISKNHSFLKLKYRNTPLNLLIEFPKILAGSSREVTNINCGKVVKLLGKGFKIKILIKVFPKKI